MRICVASVLVAAWAGSAAVGEAVTFVTPPAAAGDGGRTRITIDVWMARVLAKYYPRLFNKEIADRLASHVSNETRLSGGAYESISSLMREYFGEYAGFAQQYLFHDARKGKLE